MKNLIISSILIMLVLVIIGCKNDDFSPLGNLEKSYAASCIIDNRTKNSYVRINKVHFSDGDKKMPPSTVVKIEGDDGTSYILRDTVLDADQNGSVYYTSLNFWWRSLPSFKGLSYHLIIDPPGLPTQKADAYVFNKTNMSASTYKGYTLEGTVYYTFSINAKKESNPVFLFTMFIEYEVGKIKEYLEVPIIVYYKINLEPWYITNYPIYFWGLDTVGINYPSLSPIELTYYKTTSNNITLSYNTNCMEYALNTIRKQAGDDVARVKRGIGVIYLIDSYLYEYFLSPKTDRYSVRLDESYYSTNFKASNGKAMGFFGSITSDTVEFKIFDELLIKHHLLNGQ
jgi:hypothetical protein